ncbi:unnamed protein product [Adineta steineri]|uniref:Uncharacterized protein n=1 Tax=Adineta steineri TaxID=433720 RepID=A0A815FP34_9BILA|nr:unnamed protein product [Adineta steineri]CAF1589110.1 unnamed protein product [Adineta steineri]
MEQYKIDEFEKTYTSQDALHWYTKDSFAYRLLNKALRTRNTEVIHAFRFFMVDLHQQIRELHWKQMQGKDARVTTLYRGQLLPKDELEELKNQIGKRITMNGFLSASSSSSIALLYCGEGKQRPFYESVFLQIDLPSYGLDPAMPYCSIAHLSDFEVEHEYLFKFGTIFEVISINELTEEICQSSIPIGWFVDKKSMNNVEINTFSDALTAAMNLTDSFSWPIDQYTFQSFHKNVNDVNIYSRAHRIYNRLESGAIGTVSNIDNSKTRLLELFMKRDEAFERYQAMMVAQA